MALAPRPIVIAAVAATLAGASSGCGVIGQVRDIVGAAQVLSDFADRLASASTLTYTAEYRVGGSEPATAPAVSVVRQPPNAAVLAGQARVISTPEALIFCGTQHRAATCQRTPPQAAEAVMADARLVAGVAGPAFVTPELALEVITAAALVPSAQAQLSDATIAGQDSLCVSVTGLDAAAEPGGADAPRDFSACATQSGVLASFAGTSSDGKELAIELTRYTDSADPAAFEPPAGAAVVEVTQIEVPAR